ncbi:DUF1772 domain-containing protein [Nocardioides sp. HM23]|uniref:anthrone oxygenase family protein n=1 Tax=Nocardioides bizhenqiangii TaxID=3095076 RepID=UPI002ACA8FA0|nr:DUF1772 domain-containing protein [Nocardioides sp. HM23]MDZ5622075.1 DUF1772 domain-containing protein [Nocardioides sp. HM23]
MNETLQLTALVAATITMGLSAGVFLLYAHTIMPGLKTTDDRTFVVAFGAIDRAIINPVFMVSAFFGALVFTTAAALLQLDEEAFGWIAAALVLYAALVGITVRVHLPRNDALKADVAEGEPDDPAATRSAFGEATWVRWNWVRVALNLSAFGLLCWALVVAGDAAG